MKKLLRKILKRIEEKNSGYFLDHGEGIKIQGEWLKIFGCGGCGSYPYTTEMDMFNDLCEHYKIK